MHPLLLRLSLLLTIAGALVAGCGGPDPVAPDAGPIVPDSGPDENDGGPPSVDAGDTIAPTVIATSPADGATLVPVDTAITIAFSEEMDVTVGSIGAATDDGAITLGDPTWNEERTSVTVSAEPALPIGATITVTVGTTFEDASGNALAAPYTFEITTEDAEPPALVRTEPTEGATIDPALAEIELEVSEPVRTAGAVLRITGPGAPVIGALAWTDLVATATVSGLEPDASYEIALEGFEDLAGNPLDASILGDDGALDLTTGPDEVAPVVTTSTPMEGQLDVNVGLLAQVAIEFSEPMDTAAGTFTLEVGTASAPLTPTWDRGGRRARLPVAGMLAAAAPHRVVLAGLRDVAGNPLDGTPVLGDGSLDFTTGDDAFVPFVAFTSPEEGSTGVAGGVLHVVVVFSEAMDPSTTTAPMTGDGRTVTLSGTWSSGNTVLTLEAPTLQAGRSYDVDLRGFEDAGGTPVDDGHAYLGDGIATFALAAPTGERCGDALTEAEAVVAAGVHTWTIAAGSVSRADGSGACDPDGHGPDALVRYRKTTAAASAGGAVLHVVVTPATSSHNLDVEILAGDCRTASSITDASRLRCLVERTGWEQWLDVGAGDYFVYVARDGAATFTGATVTIEEVHAIREGESCAAPLAPGSSSAVYTAPAMPGAPHRFALPAGYPDAMDRGVTADDPSGAVSCLPGASLGHDAVVEYEKSTATSLVTIRAQVASVSGRHGAIEIVRGCEPEDASRSEIACLPYSSSAIDREITIGGPAGPISAWLVERRSAPLPGGGWGDAPAATIEITEFEPGTGDTCAGAIPIVPGTTNAVTATRPWRADVPACLATGGVTWFRYTPTQGLGVLRTNGATLGAVVDRASGQVIRCQGDDTGTGIPVFGEPGREVCIALSSSASVTQITIDEMPYSGVRGIETELFIEPAPPPEGSTLSPSLGTSGWWARQGSEIWTGRFRAIFHAPVTGHVPSTHHDTEPFSCRYAGIARPDGLYCISETNGAMTPRLYRVVDAAGTVLATPQAIDDLSGGFTYVAQRFDGLAFDGTQFVLGSIGGTSGDTTTSFYGVPAAGGAPTLLGTSTELDGLGALALDADFLYVAGRVGTTLGIWRLRRDLLATDPAQPPVQLADGYAMANSGGASIAVDSTVAATALYFRPLGNTSSRADIVLVVDPRAAMPRWVGPLWRAPGNRQDNGFGLDPTGPTIWLLHTNGTGGTSGRWIRLD